MYTGLGGEEYDFSLAAGRSLVILGFRTVDGMSGQVG
jgi:hypothetical protein